MYVIVFNADEQTWTVGSFSYREPAEEWLMSHGYGFHDSSPDYWFDGHTEARVATLFAPSAPEHVPS